MEETEENKMQIKSEDTGLKIKGEPTNPIIIKEKDTDPDYSNLYSIKFNPGLYYPFRQLTNGSIVFKNIITGKNFIVPPKKAEVTELGRVVIPSNDGKINNPLKQIFKVLYDNSCSNAEQAEFIINENFKGVDPKIFEKKNFDKIVKWYLIVKEFKDKQNEKDNIS